MTPPTAAVLTIREFLDDIGYAHVVGQVGGGSVRMFMSPFLEVQELLKNTSPSRSWPCCSSSSWHRGL